VYVIGDVFEEIGRRDKMRAMRIMLLFAVLVLLSGIAASADWHMFGHDPQHTGVANERMELYRVVVEI